MLEGSHELPVEAHDPVERARACISLLSFVSESAGRDVHVLSLRRAFLRLGTTGELRFALRVLNFLGEIQDIGHGFHFPAPLRVIPIGELALVLSPSPTWELRRHFDSVVEGYGRTARLQEIGHLSKQHYSDWLGATDDPRIDSDLRAVINEGRATVRPASPDHSVQFFAKEGRGEPRLCWSGDPTRALKLQGMALCKRRISDAYSQYFLGEATARGLSGESTELRDAEYAQFLFAFGAGIPVAVQQTFDGDEATLHFPMQPPRAERKLFLALAHRTKRKNGVAFTFRKTLLPVVDRQVKRLGIQLRSAE